MPNLNPIGYHCGNSGDSRKAYPKIMCSHSQACSLALNDWNKRFQQTFCHKRNHVYRHKWETQMLNVSRDQPTLRLITFCHLCKQQLTMKEETYFEHLYFWFVTICDFFCDKMFVEVSHSIHLVRESAPVNVNIRFSDMLHVNLRDFRNGVTDRVQILQLVKICLGSVYQISSWLAHPCKRTAVRKLGA